MLYLLILIPSNDGARLNIQTHIQSSVHISSLYHHCCLATFMIHCNTNPYLSSEQSGRVLLGSFAMANVYLQSYSPYPKKL